MKTLPILLATTIVFTFAVQSFAFDGQEINPKKQTVYKLPILQPVFDFDPLKATNDPVKANFVSQIYNNLVTYRTKKDDSSNSFGDIIPDLAEEWNVSSDRKLYNFKLKKNVYFQNGRKFDAYDVKHTIERIANPKTMPKELTWVFQDLPLRGLKQFQSDCRKNKLNPALIGVEVLDSNIIQISLDKPTPFLFKILALPAFAIIPKEVVDRYGSDFGKHPIGTGAYKVSRFNNQSIILEKNTNYFEESLPHIERLEYKVVSSFEESYKLFLNGQLDQTYIPDSEINRLFEQEKYNKYSINVFEETSYNNPLVSSIIKEPELINTFIGINSQKSFLKLVKVREALNYSVDKSKIISDVLKYRAIPSAGNIPIGFPDFISNEKMPYQYDLLKAKKLLYEAGLIDSNGDKILEYKNKAVSLNLWYYKEPRTESVCKLVKKDLEALGIKINLKASSNWNNYMKSIISGQADLYNLTWKAKYPDMDKIYTPLFSSNNLSYSTNNTTRFYDEKVNKLLSNARNMIDLDGRLKIYSQVEKLILEQTPVIYMYQPTKYIMVNPDVAGMQIHPVLNEIYKYVYFRD